MKILHLLKTSDGAHWALRLTRELVKLGDEIHVAVPADGRFIPEYQEAGVVIHPLQTDLPIRRPWRARATLRAFRRLVEQLQPDVIHSHFVGTTLTMRLALGRNAKIPRIFQVPGPLHLEHPFFRQAEIGTSAATDYWIGTCKWTCDRYRRSGIPSDRIFLSYYGTDPSGFARPRVGRLRQELGVDQSVKLVGMVAFMYAPKRYLGQRRGLKGHEDLIDAMVICRKMDPAIRCVFIGGGWNGAMQYENQVKEYGHSRLGEHAKFLGTRRDVADLYPDFDLVAHPSHSENVGGAVESLLSEVPTVATNVGGFPDVVIPGETGWLVPPRSPPKLAQAILEILREPATARAMATKGQALVSHLFDVKRTSKEVFDIYRKIV